MKSIFIAHLQAGRSLENEAFLIQDVVLRKTKDGRAFLLGNVRDKTGILSFVYWDVPDYALKWAQAGNIVLLTGRVASYKEALQLTVTDLNESVQPDMAAFLPTSQRSRESMIAELKDITGLLQEPWQQLVFHLLLKDSAFLQLFSNAPAARKMHHAYIGGLLEHSLSMVNIAYMLADHYPYVDRDLLITGALLHDMGKAAEYDVSKGFAFSEDGRLAGHIIRAIVMIEQAAAEIGDFPEGSLLQLVHLIASHHGTYEWGSPTVPKTLEAILLHQIDLLDSRIQGYFDYLNDDMSEDNWTLKNSPMFNTPLRYPAGYPRPASSGSDKPIHG